MGDNLKYIMFDMGGLKVPVLFPNILQHSDVAHGRKVVSAGEVKLSGADEPDPNASVIVNAVKATVFGESFTLGVKSSPEDAEIIEREINRWMR
jgi:hypothetical protein